MYEAEFMAELPQEEVQQRIVAARMLRGISQRDLDRLASADGYGKTEMSRVERGELTFRPGKHIEPLCRYLQVPRWWFTDETITLPEDVSGGAIEQIAGQIEQVGSDVADFQAWAERAVDRIIQDRTEAIARVDQRLKTIEDRVAAVADDLEAVSALERRRAAVQRLGEFGARDADEDQPARTETQEHRPNSGEGQAGSDAR